MNPKTLYQKGKEYLKQRQKKRKVQGPILPYLLTGIKIIWHY